MFWHIKCKAYIVSVKLFFMMYTLAEMLENTFFFLSQMFIALNY